MKRLTTAILGLALLSPPALTAWAQGSSINSFTYQGRLNDANGPANGLFDFSFALFPTSTGGSQIGSTVTRTFLPVTNGLFTVPLDFLEADSFSGADRWLEIAVHPSGVGTNITLSPRQQITAAPYAIRAREAATVPAGAITSGMIANGAITSSKIAAGSITSVQLAPGAVVSGLAAEGLGAVPTSQAVVMSTLAADEALTSRGYTRMGNPVTVGLESWTPVPVPGVDNTPIPGAIHSVWTGTELLILSYFGEGARYNPVSGNWAPLPSAPADWGEWREDASVVWTGTEMIIWGGNDLSFGSMNTGFRFNPTSNTWTAMRADASAPSPRYAAGAVWTGSRFVVWGGVDNNANPPKALNTGGQYDPVTDTWMATRADVSTPPGAGGPATVWTGSRMVLWSGHFLLSSGSWSASTNGGVYNPVTDTWSAINPSGAPQPRGGSSAIWTGSKMIVWGGIFGGGVVSTGGLYDPAANSWSAMNGTPPSARAGHLAVWTGTHMIVWGGHAEFGGLPADGKLFSPTTGWGDQVTTANSPGAQYAPQGAWLPVTSEMLTVSDGFVDRNPTAGRYKASNSTWSPVPVYFNTAQSRRDHAAVWSGTEMLYWGGTINGELTSTGRRYHPGTGAWTDMSKKGAPSPRRDFTAVWSGSELIVWGGTVDGFTPLSSGARYSPIHDEWTPMSPAPASPQTPWGYAMVNGRFGHAAVWTPSGMLVWGGSDGYDNQGSELPTPGAVYQPGSDTWWSIDSRDEDRPGRWKPGAAVIGLRVYFVGGRTLAPFEGGGSLLDSAISFHTEDFDWPLLPAAPQSLAREGFSLTAAGSRLALWGGRDAGGTAQQTGLVFNTLSNTWTTLPATGAPAARSGHSAVWTGRELLVWGGASSAGTPLTNGARVELDAAQWNSLTAGPTIAGGHTAVWSGSEMILYGHLAGGVDQCSRYRPAINGYYYLRP